MKRLTRYLSAGFILGGAFLYLGLAVVAGAARCAQQVSVPHNLQALGMALMSYAQDYDDKLPPVKASKPLRILLEPYVEDEGVFLDEAGKPLLFNPSLAGRTLDSVYREGYKKGEGVVAFYEALPRTDGSRWLCRMAKPREYFGGEPAWAYTGENATLDAPTVGRVSAAQWKKTKKLFKLP